MKLNGRRESNNVEDRRGMSTRTKAGIGGIGGIVLIALFTLMQGGGIGDIVGNVIQQGGLNTLREEVAPQQREFTAEEEELAKFSRQILASTEDVWSKVFQEMGRTYTPPILVTVRFTGRGALHEVLRDEDARTALMERLNEQEYYKHIFVCWDRTEDRTQPLTDWTRRAELPDATGAYLRAHAALTDELGAIPAETLRAWLQEIPEWTKYARYLTDVDDTRLQAAWEAARSHGAERLLGDDDYEAE